MRALVWRKVCESRVQTFHVDARRATPLPACRCRSRPGLPLPNLHALCAGPRCDRFLRSNRATLVAIARAAARSLSLRVQTNQTKLYDNDELRVLLDSWPALLAPASLVGARAHSSSSSGSLASCAPLPSAVFAGAVCAERNLSLISFPGAHTQ